MERGHNMTYICYDNEAYMNTGIQRSGATPRAAFTTTAPAGKVSSGKSQSKKNLTAIIAAHGVPYVAQTAPHRPRDLMKRVQKAVAIEGPCFINVLSPCPRGWRYPPDRSMRLCQLAADTCIWPLYEVEDGVTTISYKPKERKPVREWLKSQGRFRHVFAPQNEHLIDEIQQEVDRKWEALLAQEAATKGE
jgi:pyruvate ferredoxin oxidoreductase beta subunit